MPLRVLGIDPGLRAENPCAGVLVRNEAAHVMSTYAVEDAMLWCPPRQRDMPDRKDRSDWIVERIYRYVLRYKPDMIAYELPWVGKDPQVALDLGNLCGGIRAVAILNNIPIAAYEPTVIKRALTGGGGATKETMIVYAESTFDWDLKPYAECWIFEGQRVALDFQSHLADGAGAALKAIQELELGRRGLTVKGMHYETTERAFEDYTHKPERPRKQSTKRKA